MRPTNCLSTASRNSRFRGVRTTRSNARLADRTTLEHDRPHSKERSPMCRLLRMLCLGLLLARPLAAQTTANGSIRGTAVDEYGGVLPGASVSMTGDNVP